MNTLDRMPPFTGNEEQKGIYWESFATFLVICSTTASSLPTRGEMQHVETSLTVETEFKSTVLCSS